MIENDINLPFGLDDSPNKILPYITYVSTTQKTPQYEMFLVLSKGIIQSDRYILSHALPKTYIWKE